MAAATAAVAAVVTAIAGVSAAVSGGEQARVASAAYESQKEDQKDSQARQKEQIQKQDAIAAQKRKETIDLQRRNTIGAATPNGSNPYSINKTSSTGVTAAPTLTGSVLG